MKKLARGVIGKVGVIENEYVYDLQSTAEVDLLKFGGELRYNNVGVVDFGGGAEHEAALDLVQWAI